MSIASEIQRLSGVRSDIFTSITNKGVDVPATATLSSCPTLIDSIQTGGGGTVSSMINDGFTASGFVSGYRPFTATQNVVPLYDEITGTYISGHAGNFVIIQVPTSTLSSISDLTDYHLIISAQAWNIDSNQEFVILANSANTYSDVYWTNRSTNYYTKDTSYTPPMYWYDFNQTELNNYWQDIQSKPWVATAFTGEYVYIGWQGYQQYENMEGVYSYSAQTGADVPYPTYPTTTTGFITNEISGKESFTGTTNKVPNIYVSGFKNVVYDNSPEGGATAISPTSINLTSFSSNMLKNRIIAQAQPYYNAVSTAYSYNYGTTQSAYSGFEGV